MMKMAKLVVCLGSVVIAWGAASKSYDVTLRNPAQVSGTDLKAGDYSIEVAGDKAMIRAGKVADDKAMIRAGKVAVEASVTVQEGDKRYTSTMVRYNMVDGKYHIREIQLAGTKTMLVFNN
jgi:hypothetical protein